MTGSEGRLCNHIIRALGASFIVRSQNLKFNYGEYYPQMKQLGIDIYNGTMTYNSEVVIPNNIMPYISVPLFKNINVSSSYFQTKEFSNYLYLYYQNPYNQESVIKANIFSTRYKNNEDVFIHVRLGDVSDKNPGFSYYDRVLSQISFDKGYIASDQLEHDICKRLSKNITL